MLDITTPRPARQALTGTLAEAADILRQAADDQLSDAWECPPDLVPILGQQAWEAATPAQLRQAAAAFEAAQAALGGDARAVRRALLKAQQAVAAPPLALPPALDTLLMMDTDPPPSDDVLPGLPAGTVGLLAGMGGIGKSWTFLGLAAAVAGGQTPFGSESGWDIDPGTPGAVLYIAAEDKADVLHRRLRALRFTRWASPWIRQVAQDISIVSLVGSAVPRLTLLDQPGRWDPPQIRLDTVDAIVTTARRIQARLIILDPLRRFHHCDENDNSAMDLMVEALECIAAETGAAVLVGHHSAKAAVLNGQASTQQAARGASALIDGVRWATLASRPGPKDPGPWTDDTRREYVLVTVAKTNYGPPAPSLSLHHGRGGALELVAVAAATPARTRRRKGRVIDLGDSAS